MSGLFDRLCGLPQGSTLAQLQQTVLLQVKLCHICTTITNTLARRVSKVDLSNVVSQTYGPFLLPHAGVKLLKAWLTSTEPKQT